MSVQEKDPDLKIKLGQNNEIKIKNKYETFSIANDIVSPWSSSLARC